MLRSCLTLLSLLLLAAPRGAAATDVMTAQRVAELRSVTAAVVSPDGDHTAYVLSVPRQPGRDDDGGAWAELWILGPDATEPRPYVTGKVNVSAVQWTPDGRNVTFLAKRDDDEHRTLYVLPLQGGEARPAFKPDADVSAYSFAPDSRRVAFLAREPEDPEEKKRKDQGFKQEVYEEQWKPQRLWTTQVFAPDAEPEQIELEEHVQAVQWSPVDDRLLVSLMPTPSVDHSLIGQRLAVIDAAKGRVLARINNPGKLGVFAWSPDGRRIAFVSAADINDPDAGRLMMGDPGSGDFWPLLRLDWPGDAGDIAWLDARTVVFVGQDGTETFLGRVNARARDAEPEVLLPPGLGAITSLSGARQAPRFALLVHTPQHPAEVYSWQPDAPAERRTHSNPWLEEIRLAKQEVIRHEARDGLMLEGVLVRPLDEQPGRRYPLILSVHGGPEAHVMNGWVTAYSTPGQLGAARGFAVFYPNYRGSTGRGVAFSKRGQGDPAGQEFDDLVDAVDHLVETGLVDPKKVGVTGGSYGGYATAWLSTRYSERFAAGVMFVGISNKISKVGTTDIAEEEFHVHALRRPWDDWQFMLERSPIYHAGNSRTPLLILHGKDDPRVDVGQSRELYRHLKLRGKAPVRLVLYPGEGHGNRRAASRLDYSLRLMRWMEHYLTGPGGEPPPPEIDYELDEARDEEAAPTD